MTEHETEIPEQYAEQVREIAREEARDIYDDVVVQDDDGEEWSITKLIDQFQIGRRPALKALGLIAVGYPATGAALRAVSGTAEAQTTGDGDFTVPGDMSVGGALSADDALIGGNDTLEAIEIGTFSFSGPSGATDDGWDSQAGASPDITFNSAFDNAPKVFVQPSLSGTTGPEQYGTWSTQNITTSGFSLIYRNKSTTDLSGETLAFQYVAIETS